MGKKKSNAPRRKRMCKAARLQSARSTRWVEKFTGKNIVRGYCRWYGVDELCAVIELRQLGVPIPADREAGLRENAARRSANAEGPKNSEEERRTFDEFPGSDQCFAYIAGYTSAGFPYGTVWEDLGEEPLCADEGAREQVNLLDLNWDD